MAEDKQDLHAVIQIPFPTHREAEITYHALRVDPEPPRSSVKKELILKNKALHVNFIASEPKRLRVGVTSFMEHLVLVLETLRQFGPPLSEAYTFLS